MAKKFKGGRSQLKTTSVLALALLLPLAVSFAQIPAQAPVYPPRVYTQAVQFISTATGTTDDVRLTNAIAKCPASGCIVYSDSVMQFWANCPTFSSKPVLLVFLPPGPTLNATCTIPSTVALEPTQGAPMTIGNTLTLTIQGNFLAGRWRTFSNALPGQGRVSFSGNNVVTTFYPDWWGVAKDGIANDLPALQAMTEAADTVANGATLDLGRGLFFTGPSTWRIAASKAQHHLNLWGVAQNATVIKSAVSGTTAAIYLNLEKYVSLKRFSVQQVAKPKTGYGIAMGGDAGAGTQTNGDIMEEVTVDGFDHNIDTEYGYPGTSSEITFTNVWLKNANHGFDNHNFNGLNFVFKQLMLDDNNIGMYMFTASLHVFGGEAHGNGMDFYFANDDVNEIIGFRSEVPKGPSIHFYSAAATSKLTLIGYEVTGMANPNNAMAIDFRNGDLTLEGCLIGGYINWLPGTQTNPASLIIRNSTIIDPDNTYSLTSVPDLYGPGFHIQNNGGWGKWESYHNQIAQNNVNTAIANWPDGRGVIVTSPRSNLSIAAMVDRGQGAPLKVSSNTIKPTSYIHHVGAGVIKNITPPAELTPFLNCIQLIPDAAFTTDTSGNISKTSTAVVGQTMTMCYDQTAARWYPSY